MQTLSQGSLVRFQSPPWILLSSCLDEDNEGIKRTMPILPLRRYWLSRVLHIWLILPVSFPLINQWIQLLNRCRLN